MAKRGFKPRPRRCDMCGGIYTQKIAAQIRCPECQREYTRERDKEKKRIRQKNENYIAWAEKNDPNVCKKTHKCFYGAVAGGMRICDYLAIERHKRPCPVKNCTVYKERK